MKKILFLGNEQYGATTLETILGALDRNKYDLHIGVKQLDKYIKKVIAKANIPKSQIHILKNKGNVESTCKELRPFVCLTASFGLILTKETLSTSELGFLNFHPSLLPKLRGPSPIRSAILLGLKNSGVTVYRMNEKMDAGEIIFKESFCILPTDYYEDVLLKVNMQTKKLIERIFHFLNNERKWNLKNQDEKQSSYCKKIFDWNGYISFNQTREEVDRKIRALSNNPGTCILVNEKRVFIRKATPLILNNEKHPSNEGAFIVNKKNVYLTFRNFSLNIEQLQIEGKNTISAQDFCNGWKGEKKVFYDSLQKLVS